MKMRTALLAPLAVGALHEQAKTTVLVKATWSLARDGLLGWAADQEPMTPARFDDELGEITRPSDFLPSKTSVDVLLVGGAYSSEPYTALPFSVSVAGMLRSLFAVSPKLKRRVSLWPANVRWRPDDPRPVQVGPGIPDDGGNVAPPEQRVAELADDATIVLEGLLVQSPRRVVQLPGLRPLAWLVDRHGRRFLSVRCDTLLIDSDRAVAITTWRGSIERRDEEETLVVALGRGGDEQWRWVSAQLDTATWGEAVESWPAMDVWPNEPETVRRPIGPSAWLNTHEVASVDPAITLPFRVDGPPVPLAGSHGFEHLRGGTRVAPIDASSSTLPFRPGSAHLPDGWQAKPVQVPAPREERQALREVTLELDRYARICVELWDTGAALDEVLARHGLDEPAWRAAELRYGEKLTREADAGRSTLARRLDHAIRVVADSGRSLQESAGSEAHGPAMRGLAEYCALRAQLDEADDFQEALGRMGMQAADWQRLHRHWLDVAYRDATVAAELRAELRDARQALATATDRAR
jgi:hypothetical protein